MFELYSDFMITAFECLPIYDQRAFWNLKWRSLWWQHFECLTIIKNFLTAAFWCQTSSWEVYDFINGEVYDAAAFSRWLKSWVEPTMTFRRKTGSSRSVYHHHRHHYYHYYHHHHHCHHHWHHQNHHHQN